MIKEKRNFRIWLALFFVVSFQSSVISSANVDSTKKTNRAFLGWYVGGVFMQADFSELRQSPYFLNKPANSFGGIAASLYLGNPDKFFFAIPFGLIFPKEGTGTYSGFDMKLGFSGSNIGGNMGYQAYRNNSNKIIKALYLLAGVNQANYFFTSRASGSGTVNADTIFYYEYSKAKALYINPELMFELFHLLKTRDYFPSYPLTVRVGYNFQLSDPKWKILESSSSIPQRNNAMKGFYFSLGVNFWLKKNGNGRKK